MQLAHRRETIGLGDLTWLASKRGVDSAQTVTLNVAAFRSGGLIQADNTIRAGEPLKASTTGGVTTYVPYAGTGTLAGFLLTQQSVNPELPDTANAVAPMLDFGRIRLSKLPSPVAVGATTSGSFVFV